MTPPYHEREREEATGRIEVSLRANLLYGESREARFHAVNELAKLGNKWAVEVLCKALFHSFKKDEDLQAYLAATLLRLGDKAVDELGTKLFGLYYDDERNGKMGPMDRFLLGNTVANIIAGIGTVGAFRELCDLLAGDDRKFDLRLLVLGKLVKIGSPAVEQLCLTLNQGHGIPAYAAIALGEIGDARAVEPLLKRRRRIDNPICRFLSWSSGRRVEGGLTLWNWEITVLREALAKCGWSPSVATPRPNGTTVTRVNPSPQAAAQSSAPTSAPPGKRNYGLTRSEVARTEREKQFLPVGGNVFQGEKPSPARRILKWAAIVFVISCLFPPWQFTADVAYRYHSRKPAGYSLIFVPPANPEISAGFGVQIDFGRLFLEWVALAGITGAVWLLAGKAACPSEHKADVSRNSTLRPRNPEN